MNNASSVLPPPRIAPVFPGATAGRPLRLRSLRIHNELLFEAAALRLSREAKQLAGAAFGIWFPVRRLGLLRSLPSGRMLPQVRALRLAGDAFATAG
jgi:hypothetical protein